MSRYKQPELGKETGGPDPGGFARATSRILSFDKFAMAHIISAPVQGKLMHIPEDRSIRTALIPWVMALVALIGLSSIALDYSRARKSSSLGEAGVTQMAENPAAPGQMAHPLVFVSPESFREAAILSSRLLRMEVLRVEPLISSHAGAPQGRAPPVGSLI